MAGNFGKACDLNFAQCCFSREQSTVENFCDLGSIFSIEHKIAASFMIQSDRYLSDKERRASDFPLELNAASAAEYTALKVQHPDTLVVNPAR